MIDLQSIEAGTTQETREDKQEKSNLGFRRTLASLPKQVLVPRATKRPAPGASSTARAAKDDRTSGPFLNRDSLAFRARPARDRS